MSFPKVWGFFFWRGGGGGGECGKQKEILILI